MQRDQLRCLLRKVRDHRLSLDEALAALAHLPYKNLGAAKIDHHRALRCGFAEVVFGPGKQTDDLIHIVEEGLKGASCILSTRLSDAQATALKKHFPQAIHNIKARTVRVGSPTPLKMKGNIVVITAGTSDISVAEEAVETLRACGGSATTFYDIGVAGLHRLVNVLPLLQRASALICVAGMDGALPSVVGGMVPCPVIAVPTSIGYGANLNGLAALLAMLNTCAAGVSVVNIDNGFGAAMCALRIKTNY